MTIDANLIEGFKIGAAVGTMIGAILGVLGLIAGAYVQYACSKR